MRPKRAEVENISVPQAEISTAGVIIEVSMRELESASSSSLSWMVISIPEPFQQIPVFINPPVTQEGPDAPDLSLPDISISTAKFLCIP
jgi:hypothetical protein